MWSNDECHYGKFYRIIRKKKSLIALCTIFLMMFQMHCQVWIHHFLRYGLRSTIIWVIAYFNILISRFYQQASGQLSLRILIKYACWKELRSWKSQFVSLAVTNKWSLYIILNNINQFSVIIIVILKLKLHVSNFPTKSKNSRSWESVTIEYEIVYSIIY